MASEAARPAARVGRGSSSSSRAASEREGERARKRARSVVRRFSSYRKCGVVARKHTGQVGRGCMRGRPHFVFHFEGGGLGGVPIPVVSLLPPPLSSCPHSPHHRSTSPHRTTRVSPSLSPTAPAPRLPSLALACPRFERARPSSHFPRLPRPSRPSPPPPRALSSSSHRMHASRRISPKRSPLLSTNSKSTPPPHSSPPPTHEGRRSIAS